MRHRPAIEMAQLPGAAPKVAAYNRAVSPQISRGLIEEGDAALFVDCVDGNRQRLYQMGRGNSWNSWLQPLDDISVFPCHGFP
jgi:hypothetical protein